MLYVFGYNMTKISRRTIYFLLFVTGYMRYLDKLNCRRLNVGLILDRSSTLLTSTNHFHVRCEIIQIRLLAKIYLLIGVFVSSRLDYHKRMILQKIRKSRPKPSRTTFAKENHQSQLYPFYTSKKLRNHVFALVLQGFSHAKITHFPRTNNAFF